MDKKVEELLVILKTIEWVASGLDIAHGAKEGWCPYCHNSYSTGHEKDCKLGLALVAMEGK